MLSLQAAILMHGLLAAPQFDTPPSDDATLQVVGAVVIQDVRDYLNMHARMVGRARETAVGRAYFDRAGQAPVPSFAEVARLVDTAVVDRGAKISAQMLVLEGEQGPTWQLVINARPGALKRLSAVRDSTLGMLAEEQGAYRWRVFGLSLAAFETPEGVIRIGPRQAIARAEFVTPELSSPFQKALQNAPTFAYLTDRSLLLRVLAGASGGGVLGQVATWAMTFAWDDDRSTRVRFLAEAPVLGAMAPMLAQAAPADARSWRGDVDSVGSLQIPAPLTQALLPVLGAVLEKSEVPNAASLLQLAQDFTGRLDIVGFANPGDWALALNFKDAAAAKHAVTFLGDMLQTALPPAKSALLTRDAAVGRFVLKSAADLVGVTVMAHRNDVLLVPQAVRATAFDAVPQEQKSQGIAGPLTTMVRQTAESPALFNFYTVLGIDGSLMRSLGFWAALLPKSQNDTLMGSDLGLLVTFYRALAAEADVSYAGAMLPLLYDMAARLEVDETVVALELSQSEL